MIGLTPLTDITDYGSIVKDTDSTTQDTGSLHTAKGLLHIYTVIN